MQKKLGIYVHIPFCEKKCDYCNFVSYCTNNTEKLKYLNSIIMEIGLRAKEFENYEVDTIFVGGGTPTCMPHGAIYRILNAIYSSFKVLTTAEITVEANPNSINFGVLQELKKAKVNRLSIGLQAYNNKLLKQLGRLHTKKQFDDAVRRAKLVGFKNINVDLILGIPNQKLYQVKNEIRHLIKLGINHISAYGLIVEEGTKLNADIESGKLKNLTEEKQIKMYNYLTKKLAKYGINRYEVSNFAKSGYESKHNLKYWNNEEYLGLGAVASSYVNGKRWKNIDALEEYNTIILTKKIAVEEVETLKTADKIEERIMLSLRTTKGLDLQKFKEDFSYDLLIEKSAEIEKLKANNLIKIENNFLSCTNNGFHVLNYIILELV